MPRKKPEPVVLPQPEEEIPVTPEPEPVPVVFEPAVEAPVPMDDVVDSMPAVEPITLTTEGFTGDTLVVGDAFTVPVALVDAIDIEHVEFTPAVETSEQGLSTKKGLVRYIELAEMHSERRDDAEDNEMTALARELTDALPQVRRTIDTLVYGCSSTREREDAARPARELLDRLIGA